MTIKAGWKTSEFWITLLGYLLAIASLFKIAVPANTPEYVQAAAVLASGIVGAFYNNNRKSIKNEAVKSSGISPMVFPSPPISEVKPEDNL